MDKREQKALELTEFIKNYIPTGWQEPIGKVCHIHRFEWYEIEAIENWVKKSTDLKEDG